MKRSDLLQIAKPILFNTDMVRATLDDQKTSTRRVVKKKYSNTELKMKTDKYGSRLIEIQKDIEGETYGQKQDGGSWHRLRAYIEPKPPYRPGDILYVRETWWRNYYHQYAKYFSRAEGEEVQIPVITGGTALHRKADGLKWHPSIHMPKEAARLFLRVTEVRVEPLQDITPQEAYLEGARCTCMTPVPDCAENKDEFINI